MMAGAAKRWWFWTARPVENYPSGHLVCWGHRGVPSRAPENTLASFEAAIAAGVHGIELDVMESADGVVVVRHDFTLERTTEGAGLVRDHTYGELSRLNAAHHWDGDFPGQQIPRLEEVLALVPDGLWVNVELKAHRWRPTPLLSEVVAQLRKFGLLSRAMISSFNPLWLMKIRQLEPRLPLAYLWWDVDVAWYLARPILLNLVRPEFFHPSLKLTTSKVIARAHRHGARVNVWTVNDRAQVAELEALGVDGIITDYPELVLTGDANKKDH